MEGGDQPEGSAAARGPATALAGRKGHQVGVELELLHHLPGVEPAISGARTAGGEQQVGFEGQTAVEHSVERKMQHLGRGGQPAHRRLARLRAATHHRAADVARDPLRLPAAAGQGGSGGGGVGEDQPRSRRRSAGSGGALTEGHLHRSREGDGQRAVFDQVTWRGTRRGTTRPKRRRDQRRPGQIVERAVGHQHQALGGGQLGGEGGQQQLVEPMTVTCQGGQPFAAELGAPHQVAKGGHAVAELPAADAEP